MGVGEITEKDAMATAGNKPNLRLVTEVQRWWPKDL